VIALHKREFKQEIGVVVDFIRSCTDEGTGLEATLVNFRLALEKAVQRRITTAIPPVDESVRQLATLLRELFSNALTCGSEEMAGSIIHDALWEFKKWLQKCGVEEDLLPKLR